MAGKKIKELPVANKVNDTDDIVVEDATPKTQRIKWSTLLEAIKTKIANWEFSTLKTKSQTMPGAINELQEGVDNLNSNFVTGLTPLTSTNKGQLKLQNGFLAVWGVVPLTSLNANAAFGGLMTATVDLTSFGLKGSCFSMAVPRYPGHPKISHTWDDTTKILTLVSDVNPSGGFVQWLVVGAWK